MHKSTSYPLNNFPLRSSNLRGLTGSLHSKEIIFHWYPRNAFYNASKTKFNLSWNGNVFHRIGIEKKSFFCIWLIDKIIIIPNCTPWIPSNDSIKFSETIWPSTSNSFSAKIPLLWASYNAFGLLESRIGGQHLKSTRFFGISSAFNAKHWCQVSAVKRSFPYEFLKSFISGYASDYTDKS